MLDSLTEKVFNDYQNTDLCCSAKERELLRELAKEVSELAARPIEEEKRRLWLDHNMLVHTRPLVVMEPENAWCEILPDNKFLCSNMLCRVWEEDLRRLIYIAANYTDDRVIAPIIYVPYIYEVFDFGLRHELIKSSSQKGAYNWTKPLEDYNTDFEKLHFPRINVDIKKTKDIIDFANEIFGDMITIKVKGLWWWTRGLTWRLISLRGLEQFMMDMYDFPEELHKLMSFLCDAYGYIIDEIEKMELLTLNNDETYIGSGGYGFTTELPAKDFDGKVRACDLWAFAEAQETLMISNEMFKEFVFPYQKKLLSRFGLVHYGCCEPLNNRWDVLSSLPNLRRVSVSPWADKADMAEKLGSKYIYSLKVPPMEITGESMDDELVRKNLREVLHITRNCNVEIIMQDTHTLSGKPEHAIRWSNIAMEEALSL